MMKLLNVIIVVFVSTKVSEIWILHYVILPEKLHSETLRFRHWRSGAFPSEIAHSRTTLETCDSMESLNCCYFSVRLLWD